MVYPLISEYTDAILSAEDNFDKLTYLRPVLDDSGHPIMSSGNFAVVYKMQDIRDGKYYAVKCFTREQDGREKAYEKITNYISELETEYFVYSKYFDNELFVDSNQTTITEFPILLMEWIDGLNLEDYIFQNLSRKNVIQSLYENFKDLIEWLLPSHIAHGDLKPENIIITQDGKIKLIDYDGVYVPAMHGKLSPAIGTPQYQYINRTITDFNEYIDDFSAVYLILLLKLVSIENKPLALYLSMEREQFVAYLSKYISDVQISKLLSAYLITNSLGYIEREYLSNVLYDELKRDRELELQLIHDALHGDTKAMIQLGDTYSCQKFTPYNESKALDWYYIAQLNGNVNASCGICRHYYSFNSDFYGVKDLCDNPLHIKMRDLSVEFALCREAAVCILKDKKRAKEYFQKAAQLNFAPAMHRLSISSRLGTDDINLLKEVANLNFSSALKDVGDCYKEGKNVPMDLGMALIYYSKAANLGNKDAQYFIALAYMNGWANYPKDISRAVYWLKKSAIQGKFEAIAELSYILLVGKDIPSDENAVFLLLYRNQSSNNIDIQKLLGYCYEMGRGTSVNFNKAYIHYINAVHTSPGCSWAEFMIGQLCSNQQIVDETTVDENEFLMNDNSTGKYSKDGRRFLKYIGTEALVKEYLVKDNCEVLCDNSFNDLYDQDVRFYPQIIILPESLRRIGNNVFCASIKNFVCHSNSFIVRDGFLLSKDEETLYRYFGESDIIKIPSSVKYIKGGAFTGLNVREIILPSNLLHIGCNPFAQTSVLNPNRELYINLSSTSIKRFKIIDNTLYSLQDKRLIAYLGNESFLKVQDGTEVIDENAFIDAKLKSIHIPNTIKSIHKSAFYYCKNSLKTINVPDSHTLHLLNKLLPNYVLKNLVIIIDF